MGGGKPEPGKTEPDENGAKRPGERLLVYCTDPAKARPLAEAVLDQMTKGYKLKKTKNGGNDQYVLEYRLRTRKKSSAHAIIDRLHSEGAPYVIAAEIVAANARDKS
jgi:TusA-related sulfurtransferase